MGRVRMVHRCRDCAATALRWTGRCPGCGSWNTLVEERAPEVAPDVVADGITATATGAGLRRARALGAGDALPVVLEDVDPAECQPVPTGIDELDRVLGGGLVPGSVTVLGGEPGVGKSTLLLQMLVAMA